LPLPKINTKEWEAEVKLYLSSTPEWRDSRAKELGYTHRVSYQNAMSRQGVRLSANGVTPPLPSSESQIIPIPKIDLKPPPVQEDREGEEEHVLMVSDTQFGLRTKTFNKNVAVKRMARLYSATCRFADIQRKFCPVRRLTIFFIGDIPHGELIGKQVMIDELELPLDDQKWLAYNEFSNFLINACQWYEEIDCVCVTGNHGILGKFFSYAANWNIVIYDMLQVGLANYPQIKFTIVRDDFYAIHKIKNTRFLVLHGDKIPMYLSLPFYGIDRRSLRWNQSLPSWDVLLMGHFHSLSFIQPSGIPILINGTLSSDSRYVAQWLGIKEKAEMWTFFVGDKYGITGWHRIDLMRDDA